MKKHLFIILFLFVKTPIFSQTANYETSKTAKVYIIGVVHIENENRNTDSLLAILTKIKPDLILAESDTLSYFNKDYTLASPPKWYLMGSKLNLVKKMSPEMDILYRYSKDNYSVDIKPFDITIPNRSTYIKETIKEENKWVEELNLAVANNELPKEFKTIHADYIKYNNWYFEVTHKGYFKMNQKSVVDSVRQMVLDQNIYFPKLINSVPRLNKFMNWHIEDSSYWKLRNETMSKNILKFIKSTKAENIVIFTGLLHKYYLIDLLNQVKMQYNFELKEFYETN